MSAERIFLHDISSPLTTIQLNVENTIIMLEERKPGDVDECIALLNSCVVQVRRATELIRSRREALIEQAKE